MAFRQDESGKSVFLSVDSRTIAHNPLYKAFKARSFTDNDLTLHFILMDLLRREESLTVREIIEKVFSDYLEQVEPAKLPDESTIRKKLKEYEALGLLQSEKHGRELAYRRREEGLSLDDWAEAAAWFSEADPLGVIGSYLLDKLPELPDFFRFKHHYLLHAMDSEVLYRLLDCMRQHRRVRINAISRRDGQVREKTIYPMRVYLSTQSGSLIREKIPSGRDVRQLHHPLNYEIDLNELRCSPYVNLARARLSLGTLGGGNHFIEVDRNDEGELYLVVHSGGRHLGLEVCNYYQDQGRFAMWGGARYQLDQKIAEYKAAGRHKEIQSMLNEMKKEHEISVPKALAWVEGHLFDDYIHDMRIIQRFAVLNRKAMTDVILSGLGLTRVEEFTTIHNYIDTDSMILRKGSVSAKSGEKLLIPINMRDGSLICIGKGNEDWNCSAPHGAGRLMSRKQAAATLSMDEYREEMQGVYTTCVVEDTIDESPMAYKSLEEIVSQIGPTAEIVERIRPIYNFKASE